MFSRPDFKKFAIEAFQKLRGRYSGRRYYLPAAAVLLICLITGSFFIISHILLKRQNNISQPAKPKPVPMPTAIDPNFSKQVDECFIPTAAIYGYTLRITSGWRSLTEQQQIYDQGRTINGHIVTEAPPSKSIHNYGFAVDVVDRWRAYDINWTKLGAIAAYCGLEQGPDGDSEHFEHRDGLTTDDFFAGLRPQPLTLPCAIMDERAKADKSLTLKDLRSCSAPDFLKLSVKSSANYK